MKKALLLDFDDSFTFNVVQELQLAGISTTVINWRDFETLPDEGLLVLGPGPGHPDDYQRLFPLIREWISQKKPLLGICLGHQIYWRLLGEEVLRSKHPMHGQRLKLELNHDWKKWLCLNRDVWVQRYNSLAVMGQAALRNPYLTNLIQDDEILITLGEKVITYQFHPESVGTSYRQAFIRPVIRDLV
ncbi:MAG TPA: aminodeoxychorismate/anthranilate synthase component II [Bacteriovoracaceae bacterium]|nr:aminodeoxychorismate/anthranilate synthase component II [Bacteriovoracaceae bacterium]